MEQEAAHGPGRNAYGAQGEIPGGKGDPECDDLENLLPLVDGFALGRLGLVYLGCGHWA